MALCLALGLDALSFSFLLGLFSLALLFLSFNAAPFSLFFLQLPLPFLFFESEPFGFGGCSCFFLSPLLLFRLLSRPHFFTLSFDHVFHDLLLLFETRKRLGQLVFFEAGTNDENGSEHFFELTRSSVPEVQIALLEFFSETDRGIHIERLQQCLDVDADAFLRVLGRRRN